mgnify:CR=1 FL=1
MAAMATPVSRNIRKENIRKYYKLSVENIIQLFNLKTVKYMDLVIIQEGS